MFVSLRSNMKSKLVTSLKENIRTSQCLQQINLSKFVSLRRNMKKVNKLLYSRIIWTKPRPAKIKETVIVFSFFLFVRVGEKRLWWFGNDEAMKKRS